MSEIELINKDFRRLKINGAIYYDVPKDIYNVIQELQKENETLKRYQCKRNCASRLAENRKLTDTEILDRYQEWLEEKLTILNEALEDTELDEEIRECALDRRAMLDKCLYKLIRLKDEVNNDKEI